MTCGLYVIKMSSGLREVGLPPYASREGCPVETQEEGGRIYRSPTPDCIEYLLSKKIVGWGSQCIGTDAGQAGGMDPPYPAHNLLHRDNCFGLASLANLDKLPAKGAILIIAPLKIKRGTGSPIRAMALAPRS